MGDSIKKFKEMLEEQEWWRTNSSTNNNWKYIMSDREIMNAKRGILGIPDKPKKDKYVKAVKKKFKQRSEVGIKKYNTTLERDDLSFIDWLTHLQEELMDATLYVERLKTSYAEEISKNS